MMKCERVVESKCAKGHSLRSKCFQSQPAHCRQCQFDDDHRQKELKAELDRDRRRDEANIEHLMKMTALDEQIQDARATAADSQLGKERLQALQQKQLDLEAAKRFSQVPVPQQSNDVTFGSGSNNQNNPPANQSSQRQKNAPSAKAADSRTKGPSELDWERQKRVENASNDAIDALMKLTGLEEVKAKFLDIKAKIETVARQGIDMKKERLGMVMLGNPGTGKRPYFYHTWFLIMRIRE
jgi:hypothetical protein